MPCERKHIQDGIDALQMWLDMGDCECETATHTCGKPKIERALAGLQAALAACDESPWRSMESAPKDGTSVLLHNNNAPGNPSGRMETCEDYNTVVGAWWASDESDRDADGFGDWMCYMDAIEDPRCPFEPTHWMPLPAAPEGVKP